MASERVAQYRRENDANAQVHVLIAVDNTAGVPVPNFQVDCKENANQTEITGLGKEDNMCMPVTKAN